MAWLRKNVWLLCIAVGWACAFVPIAAKVVNPLDPVEVGWFLVAASLIGFGTGWKFRDEGGCDD